MGLRRAAAAAVPCRVSLLPYEANHVHEMKVFFMFPAWRGASSAETNGGGSPRLPSALSAGTVTTCGDDLNLGSITGIPWI